MKEIQFKVGGDLSLLKPGNLALTTLNEYTACMEPLGTLQHRPQHGHSSNMWVFWCCKEVMLVRRGLEAAQEYPGRTIAKVVEFIGSRPVSPLEH